MLNEEDHSYQEYTHSGYSWNGIASILLSTTRKKCNHDHSCLRITWSEVTFSKKNEIGSAKACNPNTDSSSSATTAVVRAFSLSVVYSPSRLFLDSHCISDPQFISEALKSVRLERMKNCVFWGRGKVSRNSTWSSFLCSIFQHQFLNISLISECEWGSTVTSSWDNPVDVPDEEWWRKSPKRIYKGFTPTDQKNAD